MTLTDVAAHLKVSARLHHSNIVPVFGVGAAEGQHFYAMQYIDGWTLREWLRRDAAGSEACFRFAAEVGRHGACSARGAPNWPHSAKTAWRSILRGHRAVPHGPAFSTTGQRLMTWSWDRTIRPWDPWNGLERARAPGLFSTWDNDGRQLAAITGRQVVVYRVEGDREFRVLPGAPASAQGRWFNHSSHVSMDGRWEAIAGKDGVRILDWNQREFPEPATDPDAPPVDVQIDLGEWKG